MSNPFYASFDSSCESCGDEILEGDETFADDGEFICAGCAEEQEKICVCGNYKKVEFDKCYKCNEKNNLA